MLDVSRGLADHCMIMFFFFLITPRRVHLSVNSKQDSNFELKKVKKRKEIKEKKSLNVSSTGA